MATNILTQVCEEGRTEPHEHVVEEKHASISSKAQQKVEDFSVKTAGCQEEWQLCCRKGKGNTDGVIHERRLVTVVHVLFCLKECLNCNAIWWKARAASETVMTV